MTSKVSLSNKDWLAHVRERTLMLVSTSVVHYSNEVLNVAKYEEFTVPNTK